MKKLLFLMITLSIFSFLSAWMKTCTSDLKMACKKYTIDSCECVDKEITGNYAYIKDCTYPEKPVCSGDSNTLNCVCS